MADKLSAYLVIYNDWDVLSLALRSLAPIVDDLVVVDGAYEWMSRYYEAMGDNPKRSNYRVYDAIEACNIPFRIISGLWSSEAEKRIAGYESCRHRFVCRIDADEIVFLDDYELEQFFREGAVSQVEIPTYIAPGWIVAPRRETSEPPALPRVGFIFDREKISSGVHLNYLWNKAWRIAKGVPEERPFSAGRRPIGFVAHLTQWRSAEGSAQRATYYMLNHMRQHGPPSWIPELRGQDTTDPSKLFDLMPPGALREIMLASRMSPNKLTNSQSVYPSPLAQSKEVAFAGAYSRRLESIVRLNHRMREQGMRFTKYLPLTIDITAPVTAESHASQEVLLFEFSEKVSSARAQLYTLSTEEPWQAHSDVVALINGCFVEVRVPAGKNALAGRLLRRQIELRVDNGSDTLVQHFRMSLGESPRSVEQMGNDA